MNANPFRRSLALLVGIDVYEDGLPLLRSAVADATRLADLLAESHGYEVQALCNEQASIAGVRKALTDLAREATVHDRLLIYFAGHGVAAPGEGGPEGFLLCHDANPTGTQGWLAMGDLYGLLDGIACRHLLVTLDCCFAGAFRWSGWRASDRPRKVIHREQFERFTEYPAAHLLTSAAHDEKALDVVHGDTLGLRDRGEDHSPFAAALIRGLDGAADLVPTDRGDGVITVTELYLYLREQMGAPRSGRRTLQTPGLWPLRAEAKGEYVFLVPGADLSLPSAPPLDIGANPWRGLASYEDSEKDRALFFGRGEALRLLREFVESHPLSVVVGPSGSGKSSLVKAGLASQLRLVDGAPWTVLPAFRPTAKPIAALSQHLNQAGLEVDETAIRSGGDDLLSRLLGRGPSSEPRKLALIVDQLEELITLGASETDAATFLEALKTTSEASQGLLHVVLVVRSDFEPHFTGALGGTEGRFVIPPMDRDDLREVIEGPASARLVFFEPAGLVDQLLDEVALMPGALPLLSFALSEMYSSFVAREPNDRALREEDHTRVGGVVGSLRHRAESIYETFDAASQETLRRLMLRMISLEGGELSRRRIRRADLVFEDSEENARLQKVTAALEEARLIVAATEKDEENREVPTVEPAHDALVRSWDRLLAWVRQGSAEILTFSRLAEAVQEWSAVRTKKQKRDLLWDDASRTAWLRLTRHESPRALNASEAEFARQSVRRGRAATLRLIAYSIGVTFAAILAVAAFFYARARQAEAEQRDRESRAGKLAAEASLLQGRPGPVLSASALVAIESLRLGHTLEAARALNLATRLLLRPVAKLTTEGPVAKIAIDPGQRVLAAASTSSTSLWAIGSWRPFAIVPHSDSLPSRHSIALALSRNATVLAEAAISGGEVRGQVSAWALPSGHLLYSHPFERGRPSALALREDGAVLALAGDDRIVRLVRLPSGEAMAESTLPAAILALVFEKSGELLVFCADGTVLGIDPETGARSLLASPGGETFSDAAVGPTTVALSGQRVLLWSRTERTARLIGPETSFAMTIDSTGKELAVIAQQGVDVFSAETGKRLVSLNHPSSARLHFDERGRFTSAEGSDDARDLGVYALAFVPNSHELVTGGADATARIWDLGSGRELARVEHGGPVRAIATTLDGKYLITAGAEPGVRAWDLADREALRSPLLRVAQRSGMEDPEIAVDSSGSRVAAPLHYYDPQTFWHDEIVVLELPRLKVRGRVELSLDSAEAFAWRPGTGELAIGLQNEVRICARDLAGPCRSQPLPSNGIGLAFTPDGNSLAVALGNGQVAFWNLRTNRFRLAVEKHKGNIVRIVSTPEGHAVTGSWDGRLLIWDIATGKLIRRLPFEGGVFAFDLSSDGRWLVAGSTGGTSSERAKIKIWDLARDGEPVSVDQGDTVNSIRVSPDGTLFALTDGNRVVLRSLPDGRIADRDLQLSTTARRVAFSSDGALLASVDMNQELRVWNVRSRTELERFESGAWKGLYFGPGNRYVLAVGPAQTFVRHWLTLPDQQREVCQRITRSLTPEEWSAYFGNTPYRCTCPSVPLWRACNDPRSPAPKSGSGVAHDSSR